MILRVSIGLLSLLLAGCGANSAGNSSSLAETLSAKVPSTCELPNVVKEFAAQVPGSKYVPTKWEPSPDTDLEAALNNEGIACTYGIQVAEVGGTILWASNAEGIWESRKQSWLDAGEKPIDLPGINEVAAYILQDGTSADEMHVWRVNFLIEGIWIQVGASFFQNLEEALPIIKASIAATNN
jgi:hypothetical protein